MRCDVLLVGVLLLPGRTGAAPASQTAAAPQSPSILSLAPPAPLAPAAVGPKAAPIASSPPAQTDAPSQEHLTKFDAEQADLDWSAQGWRLVAGGAALKDFGRRESEARQALRLIRDLRLNQHGTIGGPSPSLEYWLSDGQPPQKLPTGLRVLAMDAPSLRVEQTQAQWVLRDDRRVLFNFGGEEGDARQALAVVRKYGFTHVGTVGPAAPSMMVFFSRPDALAPVETTHVHPAPAPEASQGAPGAPDPTSPAGKLLAEHPGVVANTILAPAVPPLRQAAVSGAAPPAGLLTSDRTAFDWRQVQLRREGAAWKLAAGSFVLADFGADEHAARRGLAAMQYYRFTEECQVGDPSGRFSYFLVGGQAPHGTLFGVETQPFRADKLEVRQVGGRWAVCAGEQPLVEMGDKPEGAKQVLEVMRKQQCDGLCRLGTADGKGMTFLIHSR